jgi:hypothetical protein
MVKTTMQVSGAKMHGELLLGLVLLGECGKNYFSLTHIGGFVRKEKVKISKMGGVKATDLRPVLLRPGLGPVELASLNLLPNRFALLPNAVYS